MTYRHMMKFVAAMCALAVGFHLYFVYCFYELAEFESMTEPQRDALVVINLGLTMFFAAASCLLFVFSSRPVTADARLTVRAVGVVLFARLILEFIFPVTVPVSPLFPEHTSLIFKVLLFLVVGAFAAGELRSRARD